MAYDLNAQDAGTGACARCGQTARFQTIERIGEVLGAPFRRGFLHTTTCDSCGGWSSVPLTGERAANHQRTPGVGARIAISWGFVLSLFVAFGIWAAVDTSSRRGSADAPRVGDVWIFRTSRLVDGAQGLRKYVAFQVRAVGDEIQLAACKWTYDDKDDLRDRCDEFPLPAESVPRRDVRRHYDEDTIVGIYRPRSPLSLIVGSIMGVLWIALYLLHGWRTRRAMQA